MRGALWSGAAIAAFAVALWLALWLGGEWIEGQREGDQGWSALPMLGLFVCAPLAALGIARMLWGALLWAVPWLRS